MFSVDHAMDLRTHVFHAVARPSQEGGPFIADPTLLARHVRWKVQGRDIDADPSQMGPQIIVMVGLFSQIGKSHVFRVS